MMASINAKSCQISYRCEVLNDCSFTNSPEPQGPFNCFGYFVWFMSILFLDSADPINLGNLKKEE